MSFLEKGERGIYDFPRSVFRGESSVGLGIPVCFFEGGRRGEIRNHNGEVERKRLNLTLTKNTQFPHLYTDPLSP